MRARTRVYLSLAFGALTTVAVAWVCAMLPAAPVITGTTMNINQLGALPGRFLNIEDKSRHGQKSYLLRVQYEVGPIEEDWRLAPALRQDIEEAMNSFPEVRGESSEAARDMYDSTGGPAQAWPHWPYWLHDIPRTDKGLAVFGARACGWPFLCMRSTAQSPDPDVPFKWRWSWRILTVDHYQMSSDSQDGTMPLAPIPLPFATDMLIFAAAWWLLLLGPGDVRRWNRRRLGLCQYCAYSLKGLPADSPCPECGTARRGSDALLAHQGQHNDDEQQQAKPAAGVVPPAPP